MTLPTLQIGGLISGLDTNAIIAGLIDLERLPIQTLENRRSAYEAKDSAWQDINTRLSAVRTAFNAINDSSDFDKLVTAASSNEAAVSVAPTGSATPGTITFAVNQLATTHRVGSAAGFSGADALVGAGDFTITVGGSDSVVTASASTTVSELVQSINSLGIDVAASVISIDGSTSEILLTARESGAGAAFTTSSTISSLASTSIVEQGVDAQLTIGSGPGAMNISRGSNTITDLVAGITLDLHATSVGSVTVTVERDTDAAVEAVTTLVNELNSTLGKLGELTAYNSASNTGGVLVGDSTARALMFDLRSAISSTVNDSSVDYPVASSVGISLTRTGTFELSESKLRAALESDFDQVLDLFLQSGTAVDGRVSFVSAGASSLEGDYEVVVTSAATQASALGDIYKKPSADTTFQIVAGGTSVDVSVVKNDPIDDVLQAINDALSGAGISTISATEVIQGGDSHIQLVHASYGSTSAFDVVGDPFGLAGTYTGTDVAGTIGGEAATGVGRLLTATAGAPDGISVTVSATQAEVSGAGGTLSLGLVSYDQGMLGALDRMLDQAEGAGGKIARARSLWQSQIDTINDRIEIMEDRIDRKEAALIRQYAALETAMATLSSQSSWLSAQLGSQASNG